MKGLKRGDRIAIITPASPVKPEYIDGATRYLQGRGYEVVEMPHARGPQSGTYAAPAEARIADFIDAWRDDAIKAVLCARGGYGCVDILDFILSDVGLDFIKAHRKWLIGFSDISALHAMLHTAGIPSLHAPMAKDLTLIPNDESIIRLFDILEGRDLSPIEFGPTEFDLPGTATGQLIGGNLATLHGLGGTAFDILAPERAKRKILFIEDVGENIYEINRMLYRLHIAGSINALNGILVGQFTEYRQDPGYSCMEEMIAKVLRRWEVRCPVGFGFPAGHIDCNMPLLLGERVNLRVAPGKPSKLSYL